MLSEPVMEGEVPALVTDLRALSGAANTEPRPEPGKIARAGGDVLVLLVACAALAGRKRFFSLSRTS